MPERPLPQALIHLRQDINQTDLSLLRILHRRIQRRTTDRDNIKLTIGATRGRFRRLVEFRDELADDVGIVKQIHDIAPVVPQRRNEHLNALIASGEQLGIPPAVVQYGYRYLHRRAVAIQVNQRVA